MDEDLQFAENLFRVGAFPIALLHLVDMTSAEAACLRGRCLLNWGDFGQALDELRNAAELGSSHALAVTKLHDSAVNDKQQNERLGFARQIEPHHGSLENAFAAWELYQNGEFDACRVASEKLIEQSNNVDFAYGLIGLALVTATSADASPEHPVSAQNLELLERGRGTWSTISRRLADEYILLGRLDDAERVLTEAIGIYGAHELYLNLGNFYCDQRDDVDLAERMYGLALAAGEAFAANNWAVLLRDCDEKYLAESQALFKIGAAMGDSLAANLLAELQASHAGIKS